MQNICDMNFIQELNTELFYRVWDNNAISKRGQYLIEELIQKRCRVLYNRKINKEVIHIGLDNPSSHNINNQVLMFGPAGNLIKKPEIIITGISTSITAANGIAKSLKSIGIQKLSHKLLQNIYLQNIYKGRMYSQFKKYWIEKSAGTEYENDFKSLFNTIECQKEILDNSKIMVTQLILHGIATYYNDERHQRTAWASPSSTVFKYHSEADQLFNNYFVEEVIKKRFIENNSARFLFVMGGDAFKKILKVASLKDNGVKIIPGDWGIKDFRKDSKYVVKIPHAAS